MEVTRSHYLQERHQEILRLVSEARRVSVAGLSRRFGVSEVTIRSDLQALAEQNLLVRTHGGAVPADQARAILSLSSRLQIQAKEKARIGLAAAERVADGDAIFLDSSSTTLAIARNLKQHRYLTVLTNGLAVAQELLDAPQVTVVMIGGRLRRDTASLVGTDGLGMLERFNIQKGFFGAHGVALAEGLTDVSADEAALKRPVVSRCRRVFAVIDATKWEKVGLTSFARLEEVHSIITDDAPPGLARQIRGLGVALVFA